MPSASGGSFSEILERFDRIVRDEPRRPLIHLPLARRSVTAEALSAAAAEQRLRLSARGVLPGDLLMYVAGNKPEWLALWLACRASGIVLMPVDAGATASEIADLATRFGAMWIVTGAGDHTAAADIGTSAPFVPQLTLWRTRIDGGAGVHLGDAAVLKLTSGSTGLPKATSTAERHLVIDTEHIVQAMGIGAADVQMAAIPLTHAYGIGNLMMPVFLQGTAIVLRESFVPQRFVEDASSYSATVFHGVPFMFDHFIAHLPPGAWPRRLGVLISAGARLETTTTAAFLGSFGVKIHSFYGTSEVGGIAYDDSSALPDDGTVGRPLDGVTVSLLPEEGAPPGGGRIHVDSAAVSSGYAGGEPFDSGGRGSGFLTGDFGRFNPHGVLSLTGRVSSFINVAGRKVQPEEVETVLRQMPGVADVRVLGATDAVRGEQIVACLVPGNGAITALAVRQFAAARLAPYKVPRAIVVLDRIPLNARGKTDRRELEAIVADRLRRESGTGVL
jgi:long-chain acyl-CoA synthetase